MAFVDRISAQIRQHCFNLNISACKPYGCITLIFPRLPQELCHEEHKQRKNFMLCLMQFIIPLKFPHKSRCTHKQLATCWLAWFSYHTLPLCLFKIAGEKLHFMQICCLFLLMFFMDASTCIQLQFESKKPIAQEKFSSSNEKMRGIYATGFFRNFTSNYN